MLIAYEFDTDELTEPEEQLGFLLSQGLIIINNGWWDKSWPKDKITLSLICNDIFAWGCADSEDMGYSDIKDIFAEYVKDRTWGPAIWCIKKRKQLPQSPVLMIMEKAGINVKELLNDKAK